MVVVAVDKENCLCQVVHLPCHTVQEDTAAGEVACVHHPSEQIPLFLSDSPSHKAQASHPVPSAAAEGDIPAAAAAASPPSIVSPPVVLRLNSPLSEAEAVRQHEQSVLEPRVMESVARAIISYPF